MHVTLELLLKETSLRLEKSATRYALCGGLAANLYRDQPRFTGDLDFVFSSDGNEFEFAVSFITNIGLTPFPKRLGELSKSRMMGKKSTPYLMVLGRNTSDKTKPGLDLLLPANPWADNAMTRAQDHRMQFEFAAVPTLTVEDVILAKLFALQDSHRAKDSDDLDSIFRSNSNLDSGYLCAELDRHQLSLPRELEGGAPKAVALASKRNRSKKGMR